MLYMKLLVRLQVMNCNGSGVAVLASSTKTLLLFRNCFHSQCPFLHQYSLTSGLNCVHVVLSTCHLLVTRATSYRHQLPSSLPRCIIPDTYPWSPREQSQKLKAGDCMSNPNTFPSNYSLFCGCGSFYPLNSAFLLACFLLSIQFSSSQTD